MRVMPPGPAELINRSFRGEHRSIHVGPDVSTIDSSGRQVIAGYDGIGLVAAVMIVQSAVPSVRRAPAV
jgi:hypothetical protein